MGKLPKKHLPIHQRGILTKASCKLCLVYVSILKPGKVVREMSKLLAIGEYFPWISKVGKP